MHTDLSPHLHSSKCNQLIEDLKTCHLEKSFGKFLGACNSIDAALVKCLHEERVARSAANRAKARAKHDKLRQTANSDANIQ